MGGRAKVSTAKLKVAVVAVTYSCALFAAAFWGGHTAHAVGFISMSGTPAAISLDTTPTFTFSTFMGMGTAECKIDAGAFAPCVSPYTTPVLTAGDHTFTVHQVGESNPEATGTYTWNTHIPPVFSGSNTVNGFKDLPVAISDLQIDGQSNDTLTVRLTAPSGILELSITTGLTFTGSPTGASIKFSGTRTNLNTALATLVYTPDTTGALDIDAFVYGSTNGTIETFNGHYYQMIDNGNPGVDWPTAKAAAEASTFGGVNGYLATITSTEENTFINSRLADTGWVGGSDATLEGDWVWVSGPDTGTAFWSGDASGSAVGGAFTNWQAGQPDNFNNEDCTEFRAGNGTEYWNDQACAAQRQYYVIEYGDVGNLPYLDTKTITANVVLDGDADGDNLNDSVEIGGPNSGDANNDGTTDDLQANVSSQRSSLSGNKYVVLETGCTQNVYAQIGGESATIKDTAFDYPYGLMGFVATGCGTPGGTVTITQYYFGTIDPTNLVLRKSNSATGTYTTIPGAVLSNVTIGGQPALKVVYQIVDGGPFDQDGAADGNVRDPVGLGVNVPSAPNTGFGRQPANDGYLMNLAAILLLVAMPLIVRSLSVKE